VIFIALNKSKLSAQQITSRAKFGQPFLGFSCLVNPRPPGVHPQQEARINSP
jgi:hypothetical protein